MGRNQTSTFYNLPSTSKPRNKFKFPVSKKHLTAQHGRITPFFTQIVYPGDTFKVDSNVFARADISAKVPLDDVIVDIYYFYCPFRILDPDFYKAAGGTDEPYDDYAYSFKQAYFNFASFKASLDDPFTSYADALPFYLDYGQSIKHATGFDELTAESVCAYPIAAYWKIYNEFFRDENVDPSMSIEDLYGGTLTFDVDDAADGNQLDIMSFTARANRIRDYFSTAMLSPQKGPNVSLPLGSFAPLAVGGTGAISNIAGTKFFDVDKTLIDNANLMLDSDTGNLGFENSTGSEGDINYTNLVADLSKASAASINQFRISLAMQAWYEERGMYGTRPQEQLLQWGITAPDGLLQRPEYLGGVSTTLNALPVLNTASDTTKMSGQAATIFNDGGFTKSFIEAGVIIGLVVTRVKHEYSLGLDPTIWKLKTDVDMYHPLFANIGFMPIMLNELFNDPDDVDNDKKVFGYTEAWNRLRCHPNRTAGLFSPTLGEFAGTDLHNKWCYQDIYHDAPVLSASWLKEMPTEVMRTMTGNLITNATGVGCISGAGTELDPYVATGMPCHQYMFGFYTHIEKTAILPAHSMPNNFGMGRI